MTNQDKNGRENKNSIREKYLTPSQWLTKTKYFSRLSGRLLEKNKKIKKDLIVGASGAKRQGIIYIRLLWWL